jgi:hypothetical protein
MPLIRLMRHQRVGPEQGTAFRFAKTVVTTETSKFGPFFGCGMYLMVRGMRIGVSPMTVTGNDVCLLNQASANELSRSGD